MARKRLNIRKWYAGMSNDPSVGPLGSFYDGRGVEIRKDSSKVKLSSNFGSNQLANTRSNGYVVGSIIPSSSNNAYATYDGRIGNIQTGDELAAPVYASTSNFYNIFDYTGTSRFGVIVASTGLIRWALDVNDTNLGITPGSNIVTNGDFSSATGWSVGTGWSITGGKAVHTSGTAALDRFITVEANESYVVQIYSTVTAGSCVVNINGVIGTITTADNNKHRAFIFINDASVSQTLALIPSTDFDGQVDYVFAKKTIANVGLSKTFSSDAVTLEVPNYIYIGNGDTLTKVDTSLATWSSTDPVHIARGYTIKGLSKVGDQIYIYASNGSHGKQYIWDGVTATPGREIDWYDKPISRIINFNNVDYAIVRTTLRASFYKINGYQPELIFQSLDIQNELKDRFAFNGSYLAAPEMIGNRILIPTTGGLYSFGNISPGYPLSLVKEYTWNGGVPTASYYSESSAYYLYTFFTLGSSNYIRGMFQNEEASGNDYSVYDPGFIRLHGFSDEDYSQRRASEGYKIGAKIPSGCYINVYSRADNETGYATFYTDSENNPITVLPTVGATYTNNSNTYTVTSVTQTTSSPKGAIIGCTYSGTNAVSYSGTLTKATGTGDATIVFFRSNEFKLLKQFSNSTKGGQRFKHTESYNRIEWIIELVTTDPTKTPELFNMEYIFGEVELDS